MDDDADLLLRGLVCEGAVAERRHYDAVRRPRSATGSRRRALRWLLCGHGRRALLLGDNYGVNVRAESPIRTAREMLDQVRKNPEALTFGMSSVGGTNHTSLVAALKKGGVDVRRVKMVTFAGGGVISLQLLGGHVDVINTGLGNMVDHMVQGRMRTLAITGPRRMGGVFADVPTWKEVGVDVSLIGWRGWCARRSARLPPVRRAMTK